MKIATVRRLELEAWLLGRAEAAAGVEFGWRNRVRARLAWAQDRYGDRWAAQSIRRLLEELRSESEDLGGWSVLAHQAVAMSDLDAGARLRVEQLLAEVAAAGARTDVLIAEALELVGDA